jgi:hypothetical protein
VEIFGYNHQIALYQVREAVVALAQAFLVLLMEQGDWVVEEEAFILVALVALVLLFLLIQLLQINSFLCFKGHQ